MMENKTKIINVSKNSSFVLKVGSNDQNKGHSYFSTIHKYSVIPIIQCQMNNW